MIFCNCNKHPSYLQVGFFYVSNPFTPSPISLPSARIHSTEVRTDKTDTDKQLFSFFVSFLIVYQLVVACIYAYRNASYFSFSILHVEFITDSYLACNVSINMTRCGIIAMTKQKCYLICACGCKYSLHVVYSYYIYVYLYTSVACLSPSNPLSGANTCTVWATHFPFSFHMY